MNVLTKDKSPEEKKIFDAKKKKSAKDYQDRKDASRKIINDFLEKNPKILPDDIRNAILYISGSGVRSQRSGVNQELKERFISDKSIPAIDLFQEYGLGNPSMIQKIKYWISSESPIWIAFEEGNYNLKGIGKEIPKNWKGFIPIKKSEL